MAEQASTEKKKAPIDIVHDLKAQGQRLALHLENGESLTGKITLFDRYNLIFEAEGATGCRRAQWHMRSCCDHRQHRHYDTRAL